MRLSTKNPKWCGDVVLGQIDISLKPTQFGVNLCRAMGEKIAGAIIYHIDCQFNSGGF